MNPTVTYIVQIYFDCDWPQLPQVEHWVRKRREFFEEFTLKSLLNQEFGDFRIQLLCGKTFKHLTSNWIWHDKIDVCYDLGRQINQLIDTDYLSITRLDSDDMYHRLAMADVRDNLILSDKRECLIFRHGWSWDQANGFVVPRVRPSPPFYTHIFPKGIYKSWQTYEAQHFIGHGRAGGRLATTIVLPEGKHCVIRHETNVGAYNRNEMPGKYTEQQLVKVKKTFPGGVFEYEKVVEILADFGMTEDQIPRKEG